MRQNCEKFFLLTMELYIQCSCFRKNLLVLIALRHISDPSYELNQTSPIAISPQLFHSKLKRSSLANPIVIHRLPHTSLPISTPCTIHHSCLTVCLTLWILTAAYRLC